MSELPNGWAETTLGEIAPLTYGKALVGKNRDTDGKVPVFGSSGRIGSHNLALTNRETLIVGRKGTVGAVYHSAEPCWVIDTAYFINTPECLNWRFLYHLISHQKLVNLDRSTAIPGLSRDDYNKVRVQVAPLGEQDRIVDEIEKQFTRLDAATAALKRVQANLKRYRASVLKAACEGRLVPTEAELARKEGRDYEPADKLLQRILRERRARWEADTLAKMIAAGKRPTDDRWKQKYKEPPAPDTSNHPALPDGWVCVSLDAVADVIDPNPSHRTPRYVEHGVAFVSAENFVGDSGVDFKIGRQVGQEVLKEQIERFPILPGAFAMSRYGTIGKTCKLPPERTYCLSYSLVVIQSASALVDSDFLRLVCSSGMIMGLAQSRIQGAAIPDLGVANIRSLPIALPSREEQMRINEEAARKLSVVDQMTESISHLLVHADRLRQSVLTSAFTGQLVPQDPTDEPASALLERIRAGRVESSKKTAARNVARKRGKQ